MMPWLGSGLLRRVGLFHLIGRAYVVRGWTADGKWKIEMNRHADIDVDHDIFLSLLTESAFGLPLKEVSRWCNCGRGAGIPNGCWIELVHKDNRITGGLQLRFCSERPDQTFIQELADSGADINWLIQADPLKPARRG
ncbi:hypothetical protein BST24_08000 [Mycobacteroides franklinii]|nr:hypothetical protein BST24_08000 [Mycobacteroides franklinii]